MSLKDQVLAVVAQQTVPSEGVQPNAVQPVLEVVNEQDLEIVQGAAYGDFYPPESR